MAGRIGSSGAVRFGLPGLVLGVWGAWLAGAKAPEAVAQAQNRPTGASAANSGATARPLEGGKSQSGRPVASSDSNGTLAMITTSANGPAQLLYLIDTKSRAFAVYRVDPTNTKGAVKLEASRQYQWDLKLEHYNNQAPEPDAIKATVKTLADSSQ